MNRVLAVVGALGALVYFIGLYTDALVVRLAGKPLPAICLGLWVLGAAGARPLVGRLFAAGLFASALGDILLEVPYGLFVPGLVAFLAAHILYTVGFTRVEPRLFAARALPFVAYGLGMSAFLWAGLGPMRVPVACYVIAICAMLWRAAAAARRGAWEGLAGAVIFGLSDSLIALDRFHAPIAHVRWAIIGLYFLGQLGIAAWAAREAA